MKKRLIIAGCLSAIALFLWWRGSRRPPVSILWRVSVAGLKHEQPAVGVDGSVYARADQGLLAFDLDGKQKWTSPAGCVIESTATIGDDGTIYVRAGQTRAYSGTNQIPGGLLALRMDGAVKWWFGAVNVRGGLAGALAMGRGDTIYCSAREDSTSPAALFALGPDQVERWRFGSAFLFVGDLIVSANGSILAPFVVGTNGNRSSEIVRLDAEGKRLAAVDVNRPAQSISTDWDGTVFVPEVAPALAAFNSDGSVKWNFNGLSRSFWAPTIGTDGSLYVTGEDQAGDGWLVALSSDGTLKWRFPMGRYWVTQSPTVASDGTILFLTGPKVTALTSAGRVKWVFEAPRPSYPSMPWSLIDVKNLWKDYFGDKNSVNSAATLSPEGILYLSVYHTLYALRVGAGLATNSPWPMERGDSRLTGRVTPRPPRGNRK